MASAEPCGSQQHHHVASAEQGSRRQTRDRLGGGPQRVGGGAERVLAPGPVRRAPLLGLLRMWLGPGQRRHGRLRLGPQPADLAPAALAQLRQQRRAALLVDGVVREQRVARRQQVGQRQRLARLGRRRGLLPRQQLVLGLAPAALVRRDEGVAAELGGGGGDLGVAAEVGDRRRPAKLVRPGAVQVVANLLKSASAIAHEGLVVL